MFFLKASVNQSGGGVFFRRGRCVLYILSVVVEVLVDTVVLVSYVVGPQRAAPVPTREFAPVLSVCTVLVGCLLSCVLYGTPVELVR